MSQPTLPATTASPYRAGVIVRALSIDRYAYELMEEMAPTRKSYGSFLSGLIFAEHARRQERQRHLRLKQTVQDG